MGVILNRSALCGALTAMTLAGVYLAGIAPGEAKAAGDTSGSHCATATEASPGFRTYMPDCRAYEMVSPQYQAGWPALWSGGAPPLSADGEHILGADFGGFAETGNNEQNGFQYGANYKFSRTPAGWETEALDPAASSTSRRYFVAASGDLSRSLWELSSQTAEGEEVSNPGVSGYSYAVREPNHAGIASFVPLGPEVPPGAPNKNDYSFEGASTDLGHVVFSVQSGEHEIWPGDSTEEGMPSLYEYAGREKEEPVLVGVRNEGAVKGSGFVNEGAELISACGAKLGSSGLTSAFNAISGDGEVIYFTALHGNCTTPTADELYARVGGTHTIAISEPAMTTTREAECTTICREDELEENGHTRGAAVFQGASSDGSKVYFTTAQPLINADKDLTSDLYLAEIGAEGVERLTMVSQGETGGTVGEDDPTPGSNANVVGVVRIAGDGSRVYFLATGVLTQRANGQSTAAEEGGYNMYVFDASSGKTAFVATLLLYTAVIAITQKLEIACGKRITLASREKCEKEIPAKVTAEAFRSIGLQAADVRRAEASAPDGRFLIFESAEHLTADDSSSVEQLFEYDSQTERTVRVSIGQWSQAYPNGYNNDGNTEDGNAAPVMLFPEYQGAMNPVEPTSRLSLAENGDVFFVSRDVLTPETIQGSENVYEYKREGEGGNVFVISPGDEEAPLHSGSSRLLGTDESGRNVFFESTNQLVPEDVDSQASWYDASQEGGVPAPPPASSGCSGEACQGPFAPPRSLVEPASNALGAEGNLSEPVPSKGGLATSGRAHKLAAALKICRTRTRTRTRAEQRRRCERRARRRYGSAGRLKVRPAQQGRKS